MFHTVLYMTSFNMLLIYTLLHDEQVTHMERSKVMKNLNLIINH
jgi:hypothetical protein